MPYIKNKQVLACPSYKNMGRCASNAVIGKWMPNGYANNIGRINRVSLAMAQVDRPADIILWTESICNIGYMPHPGCTCAGNQTINRIHLQHSDGQNSAFFDGHVKWQTKSFYLDPKNW